MHRSLQTSQTKKARIPLARRVMRPGRFLLSFVVAAALTGCGGGDGPGSPTPPPPPPPTDPNTVQMLDNSFSPATRTVAVGTTVRWVNNGAVPHNTTSDTGVWASANLAPGADFTRNFATAGTFAYRCTLHAGMTGSIVVQ